MEKSFSSTRFWTKDWRHGSTGKGDGTVLLWHIRGEPDAQSREEGFGPDGRKEKVAMMKGGADVGGAGENVEEGSRWSLRLRRGW